MRLDVALWGSDHATVGCCCLCHIAADSSETETAGVSESVPLQCLDVLGQLSMCGGTRWHLERVWGAMRMLTSSPAECL
jgi:hypothetical protein